MSEELAEMVAESIDLEALMRDYEEWRSTQEGARPQKLHYLKDEDVCEVILGDPYPTVGVYLADIDAEFYQEETGLFLECRLGPPPSGLDFRKFLAFFSERAVLCRLTFRDEEEPNLVVEAAVPFSKVEFDLIDVLVREVAAIGGEMADFLAGKTSD